IFVVHHKHHILVQDQQVNTETNLRCIELTRVPTMPPKQQPSKKAEQKKKEKIIEDKTFGMKNKKGAQNQKYVQQIQNQIRNNNARLDQLKAAEAKKKKEIDDLRD
ncbi:hypothetical protein OSTOST_23773, partial [Ostertagia ostertagi]